jgi:hypothetical protein
MTEKIRKPTHRTGIVQLRAIVADVAGETGISMTILNDPISPVQIVSGTTRITHPGTPTEVVKDLMSWHRCWRFLRDHPEHRHLD